jgi:N-acetylmuramic acid 6-phosphate (MurNAc-6-P) etherase
MRKDKNNILSLLKIKPSAQSVDYVKNKKQFQLHTLLTEQRHPKTWNLSFAIKDSVEEGLKQILSVDEDISKKFQQIIKNTVSLSQAADAVVNAMKERRKIFIYGCGATGRLAKQMESALWRPFWRKIKKSRLWKKLKPSLPEDIEDLLIGEMTGGDRAFISALEGFEDLQLVGKLQLRDREVEKGDVVFCITEGGETSSVIGAILAAAELYGELDQDKMEDAKNHLYFLYNNPDDILRPFDRSRIVIENPAITRINLTTGPQAITGSTRMQAATSETFIMGVILEEGIFRMLKERLSEQELAQLGFSRKTGIKERLLSFDGVRKFLMSALEDMVKFTALESRTYKNKCRATYFAKNAVIPVFIDCAERSPTFHLYPLDAVNEKERKCWLQVWTEGKDYKRAWQNILGRDFKGLDEKYYEPYFLKQIDDVYLREAALQSLSKAGQEQEKLYDFSFSKENIAVRGPQKGDLGVLVCVDEEIDELSSPESSLFQFVSLLREKNASLALVLVSDREHQEVKDKASRLSFVQDRDVVIEIIMDRMGDPLNLRRQTALKILLNGHSTGVMARMGRVVGNTMTNVNPSNLKLIGRATYLIMSHVNDVVSREDWIKKNGKTEPISYAQANAVLYEAMDFVSKCCALTSEVELSIIRILDARRKKSYISWEEALSIAETIGLERYLEKYNPALRH